MSDNDDGILIPKHLIPEMEYAFLHALYGGIGDPRNILRSNLSTDELIKYQRLHKELGGQMSDADWPEKAAEKILEDLRDRSGISIDTIDQSILNEMQDAWADIIRAEFLD